MDGSRFSVDASAWRLNATIPSFYVKWRDKNTQIENIMAELVKLYRDVLIQPSVIKCVVLSD
jgi:hypothetical protein